MRMCMCMPRLADEHRVPNLLDDPIEVTKRLADAVVALPGAIVEEPEARVPASL